MEIRKYQIVEDQIRKAISLYVEPGACFEVRLIGKKGKAYILHGYFQDAETLIEALRKERLQDTTVTISLNRVSTAKMSADGRNSFVGGSTTQDGEIVGYSNLLIDFDPDRPSGISSTEEEKQKAMEAARRCYRYLAEKGFAPPVITMSGNGYHLLYAVSIKADEAGKALVKRFLYTVSSLLSVPGVKIDVTNHNPSRVLKLPGTWAVKGSDTEERPHRLAYIVNAPEGYRQNVNDISLIQRVADELQIPEEEIKKQKARKKSRLNSSKEGKPEFDVEKWLTEKTPLTFEVEEFDHAEFGHGRKFVLDECPFDQTHTAPDAVIFQYDSGAIAFKCLHNSCAGRTWSDVIDKYDPDLRTRMAQEYKEQMTSTTYAQDRQQTRDYKQQSGYVAPQTEPLTPESFRERVSDYRTIRTSPRPPVIMYRTGYEALDDKLQGGFRAGGISIVTGLSGSCKSTFVSSMILQMVDDGHRVFLASGELADYQVQEWLDLMAAGPGRYKGRDKIIDITAITDAKTRTYTVNDQIKPLLDDWMDGKGTRNGTGKLYLYKNQYGYDYNLLAQTVEMAIKELGCDIAVVDNLMCLMVDMGNDERFRAQGAFCWRMHTVAQETATHIVLCAHPKKPSMEGLLDMYGISGSSDIPNSADNVVVVHRANDFFKSRYQKMYKTAYSPLTKAQEDAGVEEPGNCVKLEKSRYGTADDVYIPLWYDVRCKRLCSRPEELRRPKKYGWETLQESTGGSVNAAAFMAGFGGDTPFGDNIQQSAPAPTTAQSQPAEALPDPTPEDPDAFVMPDEAEEQVEGMFDEDGDDDENPTSPRSRGPKSGRRPLVI